MHKRNIVWLASYPKSGNTWFRAFISALLGSGELDLNGLKTQNIFSSRDIFDSFTDLDSRYLYDEEVKLIIPEVFISLANEIDKIEYIKIHDAYTLNAASKPIVPSEATKCAIYIIRNPLDIVASLANHMDISVDSAIALMNNPTAAVSPQKNNLNTKDQVRCVMLSWSEHVRSWTEQSAFPTLVLRYEDLLGDAFNCFKTAIQFIGLEIPENAVKKAVEATLFDKLKEKESRFGFKEKISGNAFFRSGTAGNWKKELTASQVEVIRKTHGDVMKRFGYL